MEDDEGDGDGEWEDQSAGDLVEGSIDIFQGVVAEAIQDIRISWESYSIISSFIPQTNDVKANHSDHLLGSLPIKRQAIRQGTEKVTDNKEQGRNRELRPQEEERRICGIQNPFVAAGGVSLV